MSILANRYTFTRPAQIVSRLASLRALTAPVLMVAPLPITAPQNSERIFTDADAPEPFEPIETTTTPAPLWVVERAGFLADAEAMKRAAEWRRAGCPCSPLVEDELPFRFGFDDLPDAYFAATA